MAEGDGERRSTVHTGRLVAAGIVVGLLLWFAFANSRRVPVDYLVASRHSRLIYVILGSAMLGAIADRLFRWRRHREHD